MSRVGMAVPGRGSCNERIFLWEFHKQSASQHGIPIYWWKCRVPQKNHLASSGSLGSKPWYISRQPSRRPDRVTSESRLRGSTCQYSPYMFDSLNLLSSDIESLASQLSRPPPNLLLNSDILDILAIINAFALEKLIKQINMKLFRSSTLLTSF